MQDTSPIFVHSGFRVSSTWFWLKFRQRTDLTAYYEIFHERLVSITPDGVASFNTGCWDSRHPEAGPYFSEYLPIIRNAGGVQGFSADMAYRQFLPPSGLHGALPDMAAAYVRSLVDLAHHAGKRPVLTCGRTLGRIGGLRAAVGGRHILLIRNLYRQWLSYVQLTSGGTYYFQNATLSVLANGKSDPALGALFKRHVQTEVTRDGETILRFASLNDFQKAFLGMHVYLYMAALAHVDLVVDVSAMAASGDQRIAAEQALCDAIGVNLDLSDVRDQAVSLKGVSAGNADLATEGLLDDALSALNLPATSPEARFGERLINEWQVASGRGS